MLLPGHGPRLSVMPGSTEPAAGTGLFCQRVVPGEHAVYPRCVHRFAVGACAEPGSISTGLQPSGGHAQAQVDSCCGRPGSPGACVRCPHSGGCSTSTTFAARPIAAGQLDNKVVVVNFFASWCEACQAEVGDLGDLYLEFHDSAPGVEVIGIAFDFEHQDDLSTQPHVHPDGTVHYHGLPNTLQVLLTFLKANRAAYAVIPYTSDIAQAFGDVRAIPATFVFNRQGLLSKKYVGPPSLALLKADVQQ
ncbi:MAG: TlpA family protein disulfide reductase, partial [Chloroflexi bacterium]